jgi:hypothetical protein
MPADKKVNISSRPTKIFKTKLRKKKKKGKRKERKKGKINGLRSRFGEVNGTGFVVRPKLWVTNFSLSRTVRFDGGGQRGPDVGNSSNRKRGRLR